jgi:acyl CoA:acetate/3-ketoacid CoA transferase alpha subunit
VRRLRLVGIPDKLIAAVRDSGVKNLTCVSNNAGIDGAGLGLLLETGQVKKMISSYVGENKTFAKLYLEGKLEIEFNRRARWPSGCAPAAPASRPSTPRPASARRSPRARRTKIFDGEEYVMERGLVGDVALVKAWKGDKSGNLVFRKARGTSIR